MKKFIFLFVALFLIISLKQSAQAAPAPYVYHERSSASTPLTVGGNVRYSSPLNPNSVTPEVIGFQIQSSIPTLFPYRLQVFVYCDASTSRLACRKFFG
jgi:hypothetical protein